VIFNFLYEYFLYNFFFFQVHQAADDSIVRGVSENLACYRRRRLCPPPHPYPPPLPRRRRRRSHRHLRSPRRRRR